MKKFFALIMSFTIASVALTSCEVTKDTSNSEVVSTEEHTESQATEVTATTQTETVTPIQETTPTERAEEITNQEPTDEVRSETVWVDTYSITSVVGAEIVEFDESTGKCKYKNKCETCGWVGNITNTINNGGAGRYGYTSATVCGNTDCSIWGKSQKLDIEFECKTHAE